MVIFGKKGVFCILPLLAQIHNAESIKENMMLKCLYFFAHSSHACSVFIPEPGLSVTLLIHTCHFELLCGLCRCEFIPNPFVSPPMWRFVFALCCQMISYAACIFWKLCCMINTLSNRLKGFSAGFCLFAVRHWFSAVLYSRLLCGVWFLFLCNS